MDDLDGNPSYAMGEITSPYGCKAEPSVKGLCIDRCFYLDRTAMPQAGRLKANLQQARADAHPSNFRQNKKPRQFSRFGVDIGNDHAAALDDDHAALANCLLIEIRGALPHPVSDLLWRIMVLGKAGRREPRHFEYGRTITGSRWPNSQLVAFHGTPPRRAIGAPDSKIGSLRRGYQASDSIH